MTIPASFKDMDLIAPLHEALDAVGYETPTAIQAQTIPVMLTGKDMIGQAQTGTGKTAAFALPLLSQIDVNSGEVQVLVLTPTRELAIQVAEAFSRYGSKMKGLHILPIYGGQDFGGQLRNLKRGVQVVVGTPGRVMDHMRRSTLKLGSLKCLVLDEADEMLRMGFIDDVKWVLEQTPAKHQIALFSATMPSQIIKIAQEHLQDPIEISIKMPTATASTIRQRYWIVSHRYKLDVLTRVLESETFDGVLIFVRTKTETMQLVERLEARGYASSPLNGDINQNQRERTVSQFKLGKIDILVATDVAARGLDVDRISLVINYDMPFDTETYVHRVGRTGRAERKGEAILFATPRERKMLASIERATKLKLEILKLPTTADVNDKRVSDFKQRIEETMEAGKLDFYADIVEQFRKEHDAPSLQIAAALAKMVQGDKPLILEKPLKEIPDESKQRPQQMSGPTGGSRKPRGFEKPRAGMQRYRLEVGLRNRVKPGNIVGAIANEANIAGKDIHGIEIFDEFSLVDLPSDLPGHVMSKLRNIHICGQKIDASVFSGMVPQKPKPARKPMRSHSRDNNTKPLFEKQDGKLRKRKKKKSK
jgi:ATP-dependent RNA helicase DeaD